MGIYKRSKNSKRYTIEIPDHMGIYRKFSGLSDKRQTEIRAERIIDLINYHGTDLSKPLIHWLEKTASSKLKARLVELDIIGSKWAQSSRGLDDMVDGFKAHMEAKERTRDHVRDTTNMVKLLSRACGFRTFSDIDASKIQTCLKRWRDAAPPDNRPIVNGKKKGRKPTPISIRRSNAYVVAIKSFCTWMVDTGKATESPVAILDKLNEATDRKRERRAATAEELRKLIATTQQAGTLYGMTGPERALLYRFCAETGLRANEARNLKAQDIDFKRRTLVVQAGYSKHRETDTVPIREDLAEALREHLKGKLPTAKVFGGTYKALTKRTAAMLEKDLAAVGIPYVDDQGRYFDFHATRHTFITDLRYAPSRVAQALARHKSSAMTDRYTHIHLHDERAALALLPDLTEGPQQEQAKATGTDDMILSQDQAIQDSDSPVKKKWGKNWGKTGTDQRIHMESSGEATPDSGLKTQISMVRSGFEPPTHGFSVRCSTN